MRKQGQQDGIDFLTFFASVNCATICKVSSQMPYWLPVRLYSVYLIISRTRTDPLRNRRVSSDRV